MRGLWECVIAEVQCEENRDSPSAAHGARRGIGVIEWAQQ